MSAFLRKREILELLEQFGELSVSETCSRLSISPATTRRAFARIAAEGHAEKTWGGLKRLSHGKIPGSDMVPSSLRDQLNADAKKAIARQAAQFVKDGDVVAIDGGTTTLRLAPYLANRPVRIVTNSILIAHRIEQLRNGANGAEVFLTGGFVYPGSGLLVGPQAVTNLREYHSRWAFLSVGGLDPQGATNTNQLVVESERAIIKHTDNAVILADHSKWGRRDMVRQCEWSEISRIITDQKPEAWFPPIAPEQLVVATKMAH
jgi:DeoR/GlpR family transcriptional regulator of sugar metabolism